MSLEQKIIEAGKLLDRYSLIALSGGNVSVRVSDNSFLVTPSGMVYENLEESDIVEVDLEGEKIKGKRKPSVDTIALAYIYKNMKDVNSIIHTHQPYATAIGLIQTELPCNLTTLANATKGAVPVSDYSSAASIEMGIQTVKNIGNSKAVILKNHGVIAVGKDLKEALYACIYLEEAAKTYSIARSMSKYISKLNNDQIKEAVEIFDRYGQGSEK